MFLSELEIHGFKSFASKTKIKFSNGVTAVVGPNGCGKSNVVDAIRWVLGEQRTSVLRSDSMDNVIFNGAKNKKPLGMAEVSLTLENNKGVLSSEYSTVNVARRIFRSGDTKYLLNKANCRLKDINNLFMDTGMGPDSYSVIELKMVESLLSGKNEDRKGLLEEAAGITKYKIKKKETERKLNAVEQDLERVLDIVTEVEKNVNSLSRQAAKTRKFNKLTEELKEKELVYFYLRYKSLDSNTKGIDEKINELKQGIEAISIELEEINLSLESEKEKKQLVDENFNTFRVEQNVVNARLADKKQELAVAEVTLKNLDKEQLRVADEIKRAENAEVKNRENLERLSNEEIEKNDKLNNIIIAINNIKTNLSGSEKDLNHFINSINEKNSLRSKLSSQIRELEYGIRRYEEEKSKLNKIKDELNSQKIKLNPEIEDIAKKIQENSSKNEELSTELAKNKELLSQLVEQKEKLKTEIGELNFNIKENQSVLADKNRQLSFYEGLIDNESNVGVLLKNKDWNKKNFSTLADNLAIDSKYQNALQSLLGTLSNSILVDDINEIKDADSLLKNLKKGKQSFILNKNINNNENKKVDIIGLDSYLDDILRSDSNLINYLNNRFGLVGIFEKLDDAINSIIDNKIDYALCLDGSLISKYGDFIIGSEEKVKSNFGKIEKINKLKSDIIEFNKTIKSLEVNLSILQSKFSELDDNNLKQNISKLEISIAESQRFKNQLEVKNNSLFNNLKFLEQNIEKNRSELLKIENEKVDDEKLVNLSSELDLINKELFSLEQEEKEKRSSFNVIKEQTQRLEIDKVRAENDLKRTKDELFDEKSNSDSIVRRLKRLDGEINANKESKLKYENNLVESKSLIEELLKSQEDLKNKIEVFSSELKEKNNLIESLNKEKNILNSKFNSQNSELHKLEINFTEIKSQKKSISEQLFEKYEVQIENLVAPEEELDQKQLSEDIADIKGKLQAIGSVNFMALEEYDKENQRFIFYTEQINDLNGARDSLLTTILEVNTKAQELLEATFNQVRVNFKDLFKTLFNEEGECDITLEGENILEADLKIWAKPPGKKPHSIDMLSGGEKTLTAIALLFAIYLVKPSPFCILDEVDAPLDDSNVGRFVNLIKRFSNNTQFLIVTHNKRTMEAADYLYGITQQEEGISKVVSVELNRNEELQNN